MSPARRACAAQRREQDVGGDVLRSRGRRADRRRARGRGRCAATRRSRATSSSQLGGVVEEQHARRGAARVARPSIHASTARCTGSRVPDRRRRRRRASATIVRRPAPAPRRTSPSSATPTRISSQPSSVRSTMSNGEVVEQLVGDDHAVDRERGELVERADDRAGARRPASATRRRQSGRRRAERVARTARRQQLALRLPERRATARRARSAARPRTSGSARSTSRQSRPLPAPASITTNGSGSPSACHHRVERAGDARAEQRTDLGAGDEVAAGPARAVTAGEEPGLGVVQRGLDERAERDRPVPVDPLRRATGGHGDGSAAGGELADAGEDLRVHADDEHDRRRRCRSRR